MNQDILVCKYIPVGVKTVAYAEKVTGALHKNVSRVLRLQRSSPRLGSNRKEVKGRVYIQQRRSS